MNVGPETSEEGSHAIMDRALEVGINFFDTADVYGWVPGEGVTEQIVGRWFTQGGGRREKTVVATKLYGSMSEWPNDTFLSARNIRLACDASLKRLQTDYIDLYQMHHVDRSTPWDEVWGAFEVVPACRGCGLGVIPWSPLNGGLLGGIIRKTEEGRRRLPAGDRDPAHEGRAGTPRRDLPRSGWPRPRGLRLVIAVVVGRLSRPSAGEPSCRRG